MSASTSAMIVLLAALAAATGVGVLVTRHSGRLRAAAPVSGADTADLGLSTSGPTIVHFTAQWCGPCGAVRRVVDQVCSDMPDVAHVEIDIDANPAAARQLSVLSLPTTFIFGADGRAHYRTSGVPKATDLRSALQPLLA